MQSAGGGGGLQAMKYQSGGLSLEAGGVEGGEGLQALSAALCASLRGDGAAVSKQLLMHARKH